MSRRTERLGSIADAIIVGDGPQRPELEARAAGMQVVAVPYPGMDAAQLADADLVVGSLRDLDPQRFPSG